MNKKLLLVLVLIMAMLAMVACGGAEPPTVKTGYAIMTAAGKSAPAGEKDGLAQADSVVVALTIDADGKIVSIAIDSAQTKINFSTEGKIVTPLDKVFVAKQEMGADYGMAKASSLGKEWNEQANAFADYVVGKTVEEVKGIALVDGVATDADLLASVTIKLPGYIAAIEKAAANAQELGASAGDMIGIGILTTIDKSKDATAEAEGVAQAYSNYSIVTFDADGVITSCIIDGSQTNVKFDTMGVITTDLAGAFPSKNELGADYGMLKNSGIGKEWNEQAAAFAAYVLGKTVADVTGIALTDDGAPSDADLAASVTVGVGAFMETIEKAYTFAR